MNQFSKYKISWLIIILKFLIYRFFMSFKMLCCVLFFFCIFEHGIFAYSNVAKTFNGFKTIFLFDSGRFLLLYYCISKYFIVAVQFQLIYFIFFSNLLCNLQVDAVMQHIIQSNHKFMFKQSCRTNIQNREKCVT